MKSRGYARYALLGVSLTAALAAPGPASAQLKQLDDVLQGRSLTGQVIKGVAIAYAVRQSSKQLDKFINTLLLRNHMPQRLATKVVPILSVGERGYIGAAQVAGPKAWVDKTQVVWQYEEGFTRGEYKIKALVPSGDLNPLKLKRVERVGLSALIDVSLGGGYDSPTRSGKVGLDRVLRAGAVAGAVLVAAKPINQFINTVTFNKDKMTRVVPHASFGETAYIGGSQVTGSATTISKVKCVFEYWDVFDKGRYRVRALVPVNGIDPTRIRRVEGAGVVATIQTSIAAQQNAYREPARRPAYYPTRSVIPIPTHPAYAPPATRSPVVVYPPARHDNGLHLGWYKDRKKALEKARKEDEKEQRLRWEAQRKNLEEERKSWERARKEDEKARKEADKEDRETRKHGRWGD